MSVVCFIAFASCATNTDVSYPALPAELHELAGSVGLPDRSHETQELVTIGLTPDIAALLDATIGDILTTDQLALTREFYCSSTITEVALSSAGSRYAWPPAYSPRGSGSRFTHLPVAYILPPNAEPRLGLDIRRLTIRGDSADLAMCIFHVGHMNVRGACFVVYSARRVGRDWRVKLISARD